MVSNISGDKAGDTTFLALHLPQFGILFLPTTLMGRLVAAALAPAVSSMAAARWNCPRIAPPVVGPATLVILAIRSRVLSQPPARAALVQVVPSSAQNRALPAAARLRVWVRCVKQAANQEHVASVTLV